MLLLCLLTLGYALTRAAADEVAASGRPVTIKVLLSSRTDACYDPGNVGAIKRLARLEQERVNESGGIAGRKLNVEFLDDQRDNQRAVGNVHSAFSDPDTIAVLGLSNPQRAKAAFDSLGREINDTKIPFLSRPLSARPVATGTRYLFASSRVLFCDKKAPRMRALM